MNLSHLALALLVVLVWGFNFVVIKVGLQELPPLLLCFARFFLTSIPAVFFVRFPATSVKKLVLYGLVMFALQFALLFMGMYVGATPGLASLIIQSHVFFSIMLGMLFFAEKLHVWQIVGAIIAFLGIGFVGMNLGGSVTLPGMILVIGAAITWAFGSLISKKMGRVDMLSLVVWGSLVAWPPLLILSMIVEGPDRILSSLHHISWISGGAIFYLAYLSTLFGFGVWSFLLHHYRLSSVAPFTLLVPIFAMTFSVLILGEPLQDWKIIAGLLVMGGLCINLFGPKFFTASKRKG